MRKFMCSMFKALFLVLAYPCVSYAGWPVFSVLSTDAVMKHVVTTNCPAGEGYIPADTQVPIINSGIPRDQTWYWVYKGTSKCQKLPEATTQALKYMFYSQDGLYAGAHINTIYGTEAAGPLFAFTFTVPSEPEGWDCGPLVGHEPPTLIGCARDMKNN